MFDPQLVYEQRQMRHHRLHEEAERDRLAAAATAHGQHDHPLLGGLLMSVGAALLTAGMRMNMRRLMAAGVISGGVSEAGESAYVRELFSVTADMTPLPPSSHSDPSAHAPLADCA